MMRGCRRAGPRRRFLCPSRPPPNRRRRGGRNEPRHVDLMRRWRMRLLLALAFSLGFAAAARADYASEISAYRRANGLSLVKADGALAAVALKQAQAMAASGTITHSVGGQFS